MAWRKPAHIREWLDIVFRHRKKFFFTALPVAMLVVVSSYYVPRKYTASVEFEIENQLAMQQTNSRTSRLAQAPIHQLLARDLNSKESISQVIYDLDLLKGEPVYFDDRRTLTRQGQILRNEMIRRMRKQISVKYATKSHDIERVIVSYTDEDRGLVPDVVNRIVDNYIQQASERFEGRLVGALKFFEGQEVKYEAKLRAAETKKMNFEKRYTGLRPDNPNSIEKQLMEKQARLESVKERIEILKRRRQALKSLIDQAPLVLPQGPSTDSPEVLELVQRKNSLRDQLDAFVNSPGMPTGSHPRVKSFEGQIAALVVRIAEARQQGGTVQNMVPNMERMASIREYEMDGAELRSLEQQFTETATLVAMLDETQRKFMDLRGEYLEYKREIADAGSGRVFWASRLRDTRVALETSVNNESLRLHVIERPEQIITKPSTPTIASILTTALVLGLGVGSLMVILAELFDHSFHSVQHAVDDLKLPVLGAVNEIVTPANLFRRKVMNWGIFPAVAAVMVATLLVSIYLANLSLTEPERFEQLTGSPTEIGGLLGQLK